MAADQANAQRRIVRLTDVPASGIVPDQLAFMNNIACIWNVVSAGGVPVDS
jgi:hypothetical protein